MKAREEVVRRFLVKISLGKPEMWTATVAIVAASHAHRIGYDASKRFAVKMGCPIALWRIAYLCEMGKSINE